MDNIRLTIFNCQHFNVVLICTYSATYSQQESMRVSDPLVSMKGYLDKKKQAEDIFYGRTKQVLVHMVVLKLFSKQHDKRFR